MGIGNSLHGARQKKWISQETLPDIRQAKRLAARYGLSLDVLTGFDGDARENPRGAGCFPGAERHFGGALGTRRGGMAEYAGET